jgi:hypothetical protein
MREIVFYIMWIYAGEINTAPLPPALAMRIWREMHTLPGSALLN